MKIISGKTGSPHVTSQQFRQIFEGIIGDESCILPCGGNLTPELQTNNSLKIRSGLMYHHGNLSTVELGTYDEVTIQNGTQGMKRIDLVVNRYTRKEESGTEENEWVVIQGTPHASSPVVPDYTEGNLQDGDLVDDCPYLEVHLDGINVTEVKQLLSVADAMSTINKYLSNISSYVVEEGSNSNGKYRKWSDGTLEMWGDFDRSAAITEKAGSLYASSPLSITYPLQSLTRPNIELTVTAGGAIWGHPLDSASGYLRDFSYQLLAATAWSNASYRVSYYARGTWK